MDPEKKPITSADDAAAPTGESTQRRGQDGLSETISPTPNPSRTGAGNVDATLGADPGPTLDAAHTTAVRSGTVPLGSSPGPLRATRYGDYELIEEIARGGMGVVYRARHVKLNRIVALKMILAGQFASPAAVQRFYAEAQSAAQLDHPGIVPIYEIGEWGGQHFFAMAFVEGTSLQARVKKGPLPPRKAAELICAIADAMHYAHQKGVVHRDLKPHNVLLDQAGNPKITDFGLAKRMEDAEGLTASGDILGTPSYMAPEQAAGRIHELGPLVDVYSLGAILYTLLTGRPPFQAAALSDTLRQVIEQEPVAPRLLNASTPRDLETVCLKCLDKNPARRYASAETLAEDLGRFLDGEPIQARRIGVVQRAWRWCRKRPLGAALIAAVLLLGISLGVAGALSMRAARASRVATLTRLFESQLNQPELTEKYIGGQQGLLAELATLDPEQAAENRRRLDGALARQVEELFETPRVDEKRHREITAAIALIEPQQSTRAAEFRAALQKRMGDWQPAWTLHAPFDGRGELLEAKSCEPREGALWRVVPAGASSVIHFKRPSTTASEIAATFHSSWETVSAVGVLLHSGNRGGYELSLHASLDQAPVTKRDPALPPPLSFAQLRAAGEPAHVLIRRHGVVLQRREINLSALPPGPLQIRLRRERDHLTAQINSEPEIRAFDPFPAIGQAGSFGLHWPAEVGLIAVTAQQKELPPESGPLDAADAHFDAKRYAAAVELYAAEARRTSSDFRQEAAYKQAVCLLALNRPEEAAAILDPLHLELGPRWPALAGCQYWLALLRQNRTEEADAVFDLLQAKYTPEALSLLIADDVRDELIDRYIGEYDQPARLLSYDPKRHENVERAVRVAQYLVAENRGTEFYNRMLARAYEFDGNYDEAARRYKWYLGGAGAPANSPVQARHYFRLMRVTNQSRQALTDANQLLASAVADPPSIAYGYLLLERARTRIALGEPDAAVDADIAALRAAATKALAAPKGGGDWRHILSELSLLEGFRLVDRQQPEEAQQLWKADFAQVRGILKPAAGYIDLHLKATILGSLCGELTDEEAQAFLNIFMGAKSDSPALAFIRNATSGEAASLTDTLQVAWRTPRGQSVARQFSLECMPKREMLKLPMQLMFVEFARANAFRGSWTSEQEQFAWESAELCLNSLVDEGTLSFDQLLPLALAWKGFGALGAWIASKDRLTPELQPRLAYFLAHRQIQRKAPASTTEAFFKAAVELAPADSVIARLAKTDLALFKTGKGQLTIRSAVPEPVTLLVKPAMGEAVRVELSQPEQAIDLAAGSYQVELVAPPAGLRLSAKELTIGPAQQMDLHLE